jgi:hypothetical protein
LAHFGHGQVVAKWSPPLQIWHPPNTIEEDDASGLCTIPLKKLINVLFKTVTCFSILVFEAPSSCSSFRGSYGVFPSLPKTHPSSIATPINSSISLNVLTTHNFRILSLNLAKNLFICLTSYIMPL